MYLKDGARRACSHTIRFAAEPGSDKFPATVLTHPKMSHDFFTSCGDMAAAMAATLPPSRRTENTFKDQTTEFRRRCNVYGVN